MSDPTEANEPVESTGGSAGERTALGHCTGQIRVVRSRILATTPEQCRENNNQRQGGGAAPGNPSAAMKGPN